MKTQSLYKVALAQINATVGDIGGNTEKVIKYIKKARGANLVIGIHSCKTFTLSLAKSSFIST